MRNVAPLYFRIDRFSHHFTITQYNPLSERAIKSFSNNLIQYGLIKRYGRFERMPVKMYAARCKVEREYRFHINHFDQFIVHCSTNGMPRSKLDIIDHIPERGADVGLALETTKTPREDQVPILEYLASKEPSMTKMVGIQPGGGKTFCAMNGICAEGKRMVAVLKPKYIDKWVSDVCELANCTKDDVLVVKGSVSIMGMLVQATEGTLKQKVIIISNRTLQNWISLYEEHGDKILDMGYDCTPCDLFKVLQADVRLIDEVHEDFHLNFKIDLYTHVHKAISLSATLIDDNQLIASMMETAYPLSWRYNEAELKRFYHSHSYHFNIHKPERVKAINPANGMYSHHLVEQSIIADYKLLIDYFSCVKEILDEKFVDNYIGGTRALVFCTSVDMCTLLTEWLRGKYIGADIRRYVEDDPYENLMDARISVSTIQSAGTGHDIKGLKTVVLTSAVNSSRSNIQGAGRLRYIPDMELDFYYFVCSDIPRQIEYHEQKRKILLERALTHDDIYTGKFLGQ